MEDQSGRPPDGPTGGGRSLHGSGFPDDDGAEDRVLAGRLADYAAATPDTRATAYAGCLAALTTARVLVPVVAVLGEAEVDAHGRTRDKSSDMAAVLLTGRDGRTALLAFTALATMAAWDPAARPVPVTAQVAAQSALQEGAQALLLDVAGPTRLVVEGPHLEGLARGWTPARVGDDWAWVGQRPGDDSRGGE